MSKYDFIKNGNTLYWNAPDNGKASGAYKVISAPKEIDEDSIILIASDHSEAEVFPSELFPFGMTMSHKEDFQRWKARYEAEGTIFYDRLSEVTYTDRDLSVGDRVIFTNDHGVVFGPHEVLAFGKPVNGRCVKRAVQGMCPYTPCTQHLIFPSDKAHTHPPVPFPHVPPPACCHHYPHP